MLLYNITYAVSIEVHVEWMKWMKGTHIPEIMSCGIFHRHQMLRLLEMDETESITFAVQFYTDSEEAFRQYTAQYAPALRLKATQQWGDQVVAFRTIMSIVQ